MYDESDESDECGARIMILFNCFFRLKSTEFVHPILQFANTNRPDEPGNACDYYNVQEAVARRRTIVSAFLMAKPGDSKL